jgi:hypothetical protein
MEARRKATSVTGKSPASGIGTLPLVPRGGGGLGTTPSSQDHEPSEDDGIYSLLAWCAISEAMAGTPTSLSLPAYSLLPQDRVEKSRSRARLSASIEPSHDASPLRHDLRE